MKDETRLEHITELARGKKIESNRWVSGHRDRVCYSCKTFDLTFHITPGIRSGISELSYLLFTVR